MKKIAKLQAKYLYKGSFSKILFLKWGILGRLDFLEYQCYWDLDFPVVDLEKSNRLGYIVKCFVFPAFEYWKSVVLDSAPGLGTP